MPLWLAERILARPWSYLPDDWYEALALVLAERSPA